MISPVTAVGHAVLVYDVTQAITATTNTIVLAAVSADAAQTQTLYTAVVSLVTFDPTGGCSPIWPSSSLPMLTREQSAIQWVARSNKTVTGTLDITALSCGGSTPTGEGVIALGTKAFGGLLSDNYTIPAVPDGADPVPVPPPQVYQSILQVVPGNLSAGFFEGTFTMFKMANETVGACFSNMDNSLTVQFDFSALGVAHNLFSCPAPNGFTDLFVASDHGIAFFPSSKPDQAPQVVLPSTAFKQIVASQNGLTLVVLAVSASNDMYYIKGTRAKPNSTAITWEASGLPIRSDVREISTQYNVSSASVELIYVTNSNATVKHLYLAPQSSLWQETIIAVRPAANQPQSLTYPAHITSIQPLNAQTGLPVGPNYPVVRLFLSPTPRLSPQPLIVLCVDPLQ